MASHEYHNGSIDQDCMEIQVNEQLGRIFVAPGGVQWHDRIYSHNQVNRLGCDLMASRECRNSMIVSMFVGKPTNFGVLLCVPRVLQEHAHIDFITNSRI